MCSPVIILKNLQLLNTPESWLRMGSEACARVMGNRWMWGNPLALFCFWGNKGEISWLIYPRGVLSLFNVCGPGCMLVCEREWVIVIGILETMANIGFICFAFSDGARYFWLGAESNAIQFTLCLKYTNQYIYILFDYISKNLKIYQSCFIVHGPRHTIKLGSIS